MTTETIDMSDTLTAEPPVQAPESPQAPAPDPAAPFGRTPKGRPRSKPLSGRRGRPKGTRTSVIGAKGSQRKPPGKGPMDYRPGILRLSQVVLLPLSFRVPVDAYTVTAHLQGDDTVENPGLARAVSNAAQEYPQVAAVLDKVLQAGPLSELAACTVPLLVQLLVNHNRLPLSVGSKLGAVDPAAIAEHLAAQGDALAQAA